MRLKPRVDALERQLAPEPAQGWVRVFQYEDQTIEQAYALHEAQHGPIGQANVILRVIGTVDLANETVASAVRRAE